MVAIKLQLILICGLGISILSSMAILLTNLKILFFKSIILEEILMLFSRSWWIEEWSMLLALLVSSTRHYLMLGAYFQLSLVFLHFLLLLLINTDMSWWWLRGHLIIMKMAREWEKRISIFIIISNILSMTGLNLSCALNLIGNIANKLMIQGKK